MLVRQEPLLLMYTHIKCEPYASNHKSTCTGETYEIHELCYRTSRIADLLLRLDIPFLFLNGSIRQVLLSASLLTSALRLPWIGCALLLSLQSATQKTGCCLYSPLRGSLAHANQSLHTHL